MGNILVLGEFLSFLSFSLFSSYLFLKPSLFLSRFLDR
jgi:hypothetical protein